MLTCYFSPSSNSHLATNLPSDHKTSQVTLLGPVHLRQAPTTQVSVFAAPSFRILDYHGAMTHGMFEVECPCCQAVLKIDPETRAVIAHTIPVKPLPISDLGTQSPNLTRMYRIDRM